MGKKRVKKIIPETSISRPKNDGKKSSGKRAKTRIFYTHEYRDQKMWGKKREKKMFQITHDNRERKRWKKIFWKKCENKFFLNTKMS